MYDRKNFRRSTCKKILPKEAGNTELPNRIFLFQAVPKGERMEYVIQKAVELGVYEIIPVEMKYCVVRLDDKRQKGEKKSAGRRLQRVPQNRQSGAGFRRSIRL